MNSFSVRFCSTLWSKNSSRSPPSRNSLLIAHCSAPFEDKAGPGGLLPGEIPGILNICDICAASPSSAVPSTPSRNTSAGRPVVLDTALLPLPCSFLPASAKETRSDCLCLGPHHDSYHRERGARRSAGPDLWRLLRSMRDT